MLRAEIGHVGQNADLKVPNRTPRVSYKIHSCILYAYARIYTRVYSIPTPDVRRVRRASVPLYEHPMLDKTFGLRC